MERRGFLKTALASGASLSASPLLKRVSTEVLGLRFLGIAVTACQSCWARG